MCTVMLRFTPAGVWPVIVAAVRDEFMARPWDAPAAYWPDHPGVIGGRDRTAGGTWMAVDPARSVVTALLNGVRRGPLPDGTRRPTRGRLALDAIAPATSGASAVPGLTAAELADYDGFHLVRADPGAVVIWSWDGASIEYRQLDPGPHIVVNLGPDRADDPLVPHFAPLLAAMPAEPPLTGPPQYAWGAWTELLRGDGLAPDDPRGLVIAHEFDGGRYGSTSASLVALGRDGRLRYDFTATPERPDWRTVLGG